MFAHERLLSIQQLLSRKQRITVSDLQKELNVSSATLRRDLAELEKKQLVVRVHGGIIHPATLRGEPSFNQKETQEIPAKRAIAQATAKRIPDKSILFIDSGTTCLEIGRLLLQRSDLTLITNSIPLLSHAQTHGTAKVICMGGELREVSGALTGSLALTWMSRITADIAVIASSGLSLKEGASTTELTEAAIKQEFVKRAKKRILVADASKWNVPSTIKFADWNDFDEWITNAKLSPKERQVIAGHKVKITQVTINSQ